MPTDNRNLASSMFYRLGTTYENVEESLNPAQVLDNLNFSDRVKFTNGSGSGRMNLQFYRTYTVTNETITLNLDDGSLKSRWNDVLDYDAVKILIVKNNTSADDGSDNRPIKVIFKDDQYILGNQGVAIRVEPDSKGIQSEDESTSETEDTLTIHSDNDNSVSVDLILLGSEDENTSSSSSGL